MTGSVKVEQKIKTKIKLVLINLKKNVGIEIIY